MSCPLVPTSGCADLTGQSDDCDKTMEPPSHHVLTDILKDPRLSDHVNTLSFTNWDEANLIGGTCLIEATSTSGLLERFLWSYLAQILAGRTR